MRKKIFFSISKILFQNGGCQEMQFARILEPENKEEIGLEVYFGRHLSLNGLSIVSEPGVRVVYIMRVSAILTLRHR